MKTSEACLTNTDDRFARLQRLPIYWYNKASDLRAAAGAVWVALKRDTPDSLLGFPPGFRMSAACPLVYQMLCGQALELCLKAVIVAKGNLPEQTHQLDRLCQDAGVTYSKKGMGLLRVLSESIVWYARYPIPTGSAAKSRAKYDSTLAAIDEALFDKQPLGKFLSRKSNHAIDWSGFNQLWRVAHEEYWRHHRNA